MWQTRTNSESLPNLANDSINYTIWPEGEEIEMSHLDIVLHISKLLSCIWQNSNATLSPLAWRLFNDILWLDVCSLARWLQYIEFPSLRGESFSSFSTWVCFVPQRESAAKNFGQPKLQEETTVHFCECSEVRWGFGDIWKEKKSQKLPGCHIYWC